MENTLLKNEVKVDGDLLLRFTSYLDVSPKTVETYAKALRRFTLYLEKNGITTPTRENILAYRRELRLSCKPSTIQNYIIAVRLFFRWTESERLYPNIADKVKGAKLSREHKKDYLTSGQIKLVLGKIERDSLKGLRDYAMLALMVTGGLRTIEVVRANAADIRTVGNNTVLFIQGKGREEKTEYIKIQPPVEAALRAYMAVRNEQSIGSALFTSTSNNNHGQRLTTRSVSGIVKERLRNAGFDSETLTAHSLRHTAVTLSLLGGISLEEVQQFARHANISTTQIYAHNLDRAENKCEQVIANAIF